MQLLVYLTWSELAAAMSNFFYTANEPDVVYNPDGSFAHVGALCRVQASVMQFAYTSSFVWMLCLAFNAYLQVFYLEAHPKKFEWLYMVVAWGLPAIDMLSLTPVLLDELGPTDLWCWIGDRHRTAQWIHFYVPLIGIFAVVVLLHVIMTRELRARIARGRFGHRVGGGRDVAPAVPIPIAGGGVTADELHTVRTPVPVGFERSITSLTSTWRTYLILFFLVRAPSVVHRAWEWAQTSSNSGAGTPAVNILELLHAIASPLQGVLLLVLFFQNPRAQALIAQRWRAWRVGTTVSGRPVRTTRGTGTTDVTSNTSSGYHSLDEHDIASLRPGAQSVFPPEVLSHLESAHLLPQNLLPPTAFRAFPVHATQAELSSTAGSDELGSLRIMTGTWNLGNEPPPLDLSHPSFDSSDALPTDASHALNSWLPSGSSADEYDIIAVGAQECEYDTLIGRSRRSRLCCAWRDRERGVPTTERHWFETVIAVVNRGRDQRSAPHGGARDGRPFQLVSAISMGHMRLLVLVHPRHAHRLRDVRSSVEGAGLAHVYANKGGVGVSLRLGLRQLAFVNVHLAALDGFAHDRNEDVAQILARLQLQGSAATDARAQTAAAAAAAGDIGGPSRPSHARSRARKSFYTGAAEDDCTCALEQDATLAFDACVFMGDLNYRMDVPLSDSSTLGTVLPTGNSRAAKKARQRDAFAQVSRAIEQRDYAFLESCDELLQLMRDRRLFVGWREGALTFKPTYKYRPALRAKLVPRANQGRRRRTQSASSISFADTPAHESESTSITSHGATSPASPSSSSPPSSIGRDVYASKRTPAWCDRILFRSSRRTQVRVVEYCDVPDIDTSDHKPVRATLDLVFDAPPIDQEAEQASLHDLETENHTSPRVDDTNNNATAAADTTTTPTTPTVPLHAHGTSSPPRRRRRVDSDAALVNAETFLQANPGALEVLSPESLRLLETPTHVVAAAATAAARERHTYRVRFARLALYDALDAYGAPLLQPYISFLGDSLCARADCGVPSTGACIRSHTSIATPLPSAGDALLAAARVAGHCDAASPFQSAPTALAGACVRVAEWDAATDASGAQAVGGGLPQNFEIPVLHTAHRLTRAELRATRLQLLVKDALTVGEADSLGAAEVELADGLMTGGAQADPVFFLAPVLKQTKLMGFLAGYFKVEAV